MKALRQSCGNGHKVRDEVVEGAYEVKQVTVGV